MDHEYLQEILVKGATVVVQPAPPIASNLSAVSKGAPMLMEVAGTVHSVRVLRDSQDRVTIFVESEEVRSAVEEWKTRIS